MVDLTVGEKSKYKVHSLFPRIQDFVATALDKVSIYLSIYIYISISLSLLSIHIYIYLSSFVDCPGDMEAHGRAQQAYIRPSSTR